MKHAIITTLLPMGAAAVIAKRRTEYRSPVAIAPNAYSTIWGRKKISRNVARCRCSFATCALGAPLDNSRANSGANTIPSTVTAPSRTSA